MQVTLNVARKYGAKLSAAAALAASAVSAMAADPATAIEALQSTNTNATAFGPVMFGMAAVSVGILIGVKWIKRGRGAA